MDAIFVGMDLGTFNTAVACSNGAREVFQTAVGWPKDHLARQMIGRDVVLGDEIDQHRLALEIIRPFQKGALKYVDLRAAGLPEKAAEKYGLAARLLVRHAISLVAPPQRTMICGVVGTPSQANLRSKQFLLQIAQEAMDVAALVPEPFAAGYGIKQCENALVIDIGAGTIDFCHMYGALPTEQDQLTVPFGGDFVDEEFCARMQAAHPQARLSLNMARKIKEKYGFAQDDQAQVKVKLPVVGRPPQEFDVTEPLREACELMVTQIVTGAHQLLGQIDPDFHQAVISNIVLSGGGSQLKGLDQALEAALREYGRISVTRVCDTAFAGAVGALRLAMGMPPENWEDLRRLNQRATGSALPRAA